MKRLTITLLTLLMSMGAWADVPYYECEYEYDNKTFEFSTSETSDHIRNTLRLFQAVDSEYVIFDSEGKPVAIEGNPIFPLEILDAFNEISYDGFFTAEWNHAYTDFDFDNCDRLLD